MNSQQPSGKKAPYKRKMTEKRRDQNRAAQKLYRARRKERLVELEHRKTITENHLLHDHNEDCLQEASLMLFHPSSSHSELSGDSEAPSADDNDSDILQLKRLLSVSDPKNTELLEFALQEKPSISKIVLAGLQTLKQASDEATHPPALSSTDPKLPWMILDATVTPLNQNSLTDGIFLRHQNLMDVFHHNCQKIGLRFEQMTKPTCQSPWYSPFSSFPAGLVPIEFVPPDLVPTPAQRRFAHHPFLDLVPWPWLRERAIMLDSLDPPAYNRHELKADILNGGLVCWKSSAKCEGLPWDRRSWEVKDWFLDKWGWLVEEQGKVEMQSRWWKALKDE